MKKGLMSFEAVFSLAVLIVFIGSLSILSSKKIDTTIYEYQLLNDILEVTEKNGGIERLSKGDVTVISEMQQIAEIQGYCLDIQLEFEDRTLQNLINNTIIIDTNINLNFDFPSSCEENENKVSTTRTIPTYLGEIIVLKAEMWKQ